MIKVTVKLFAGARELAGGQATVDAELTDDATIADLRTWLSNEFPALAPLLASAAFAIDADYAADSTRLTLDAEVACIPPVSGG